MQVRIPVSPRRIAGALTLLVLVLIAADLAALFANDVLGYTRIVDRFDTDLEGNLPSLYAAGALLFAAILAAVIAAAKQANHDRFTRHWQGLALLFLLLSVDEALSIHEALTLPLRSLLKLTLFLWYAWIVPAALFVVGFVLVNIQFLLHLPKRIRHLFIVSGALLVGGALGFESLAAAWDYLYDPEGLGFTYLLVVGVLTAIEEALEMVGVVVFIYALLSYMSAHVPEILVCIGAGQPRPNAKTDQSRRF